MTYFLPEGSVAPVKARGPDLPVQEFSDAVGAGFDLAQMETNANFRFDREIAAERRKLVEAVLPRFTDDEMRDYAKTQGVGGSISRRDAEVLALGGDGGSFLDMARVKAALDPGAWEGIDLSDEAREETVKRRLQAEHKAAQDVVAMTPGAAAIAAPFIGGMAGVTADVRNLPFLFFGGGTGSFWRGVGTSAAANVLAEAAFLPSQFEMAERLNIPDPNVLETLALAAGAGAVLEAGVRGIGAGGRALAHAIGRDRLQANVPGFDPQWQQIITDAMEDAMANGDDPLRALSDVLGYAPEPKPEPLPGRPPLVPDEPAATPQSAPTAESAPEPPPLPQELRELITRAQEDEAASIIRDFPIMRFKHPLVEWLKDPAVAGGVQYRRKNPLTGEMELTHVAQELANAGITPKTHPFLFRKSGHGDLDNIVAAEHPGLAEVVPVDPQTGYFDRDALVQALIREVSSGEKTPMNGSIAARMDASRAMDREVTAPLDDFVAGRAAENETGFFVDPLTVQMFPEDIPRIERAFDEWVSARGWTLLEREREEILYELRNRGGDAEYLVEQAMSRELDAAEYAVLRPVEERAVDESLPFGNDRGTPESDADPFGVTSGEPGAATGATPEPGTGAGEPTGASVERTAAGDQLVIPGAERVAPHARGQAEAAARAQQSMIRRGDQTRVEDDPGTLFGAGAQPDMFDDPGSPKARPAQDQALADIRDRIDAAKEAGTEPPPVGFTDESGGWNGMTTLDGTPIRSAEEGLNYLDDLSLFADLVAVCGTRSP